jgi:cytochrome o ubiquinol oxidase subunit 2
MDVARLLALATLSLLGGCSSIVLHPAGDVAVQQRNLLLISTGLMLIIIIPVMALTILFAWRYRQSNAAARYEPDWDHSTPLELVIWAAPLLIIICLGAITWMGTHLLDPYRPLDRIARGKAVTANTQALEVQVVALDWKWLFIYPQYGVGTINELAVPLDRPIAFRITSSAVMNSFYAPALAGQIYAMPGMETTLHAVANRTGEFEGFSANYSGAGFSGMRFRIHALAPQDFNAWVEKVKAGGGRLGRSGYLALERPSEDVPPQRFAAVDRTLFQAAVNLCVDPGKMCLADMMRIDARGGLGLSSARTAPPLADDTFAHRGAALGPAHGDLAALCLPPATKGPVQAEGVSKPAGAALTGAGLNAPQAAPRTLLSSAAFGRNHPPVAAAPGL